MKLLILGGSGFVSSRLADMALVDGHEVWTVTRGLRAAVPGVHVLTCDRADADALRRTLATEQTRFDAAIDCICFNPAHAQVDLTVLPEFTDRLAVISTDSVYDPFHKRVPQDEDGAAYMEDGGYGCLKRRMEEIFLTAETPLRWTIFRPGHIFGPGSELGCFPEAARLRDLLPRMFAGEPIALVGGGQYLIHPIFVDDLCRALLDCLPLPGCDREIFCIGGPDIVPNARYYELIGEIIGRPAVLREIPEAGYLVAHPECSGNLCHRAYTLDKLAAAGVPLPATPLAEGLRRHIAWLMAREAAEN